MSTDIFVEIAPSILWPLLEKSVTFKEFFNSVCGGETPPEGVPPLVSALWYERKGDWDRAHRIAQEIADAEGAWVHAYLHRREGDLGNAAYWYRRAGRPVCDDDLPSEWETIVRTLLGPA